jgi:glycosyltransferase involved in cell wall biosynthesis
MNVVVGLTKLNDYTGSEVYCLELVKALREAGHQVEVFALYGSAELEAELGRLGASLCVFPRPLRLRPDRAVCMHPLASALLLRRLRRKVPALSISHGVIAGEAPVCATRIDRWIAVSPFVADHLVEKEQLRRKHIRVVPNGIDLDRFAAPEVETAPERVRVLWASTYLPLRKKALEALCAAVVERPDAELTVVADLLPRGLVPKHDRIRVVEKSRDAVELIRDYDVVAGLGPGRILLEALAMNRAALCLNVEGAAVYLDAQNLERVEFYRDDWGGPAVPLLDPAVVLANSNRRDLAESRYDAAVNVSRVVSEVEQLSRRTSSPRRYRLVTLRRLPWLALNLALVPWLKLSGRSSSRPPVLAGGGR